MSQEVRTQDEPAQAVDEDEPLGRDAAEPEEAQGAEPADSQAAGAHEFIRLDAAVRPSNPGYDAEVVSEIGFMAKSVTSEARAAWIQGRIWVPFGGMLALVAPAVAFVAGFQGLGTWVGKEGVTVLAFASGLLGVVALWARKQGETEGVTERLRAAALYALASDIRYALAEYGGYTNAIASGQPVPGYGDYATAFVWLCGRRDEFVKTRASLEKFVYNAPVQPADGS